ncbi:ATP-binding protein [Arthrobacter sp. ISL-69]|uniref:AAA family ATPase n=1 Tax=Arthrobacter sp. ISL-69 TaxID=2819113 RepID=UPI001BEAF802|nr:ATP-binding protein [Arthrobacter sp. ISL-69]MBT2534848.1 ATP-binding protein [Arthrobacter sp. ISL-69]
MTEEMTSEAIIVCGVPASGKTTFAHDLARELRWTFLDLDTLTNPLFEHMGGEFLVDVPTAQPPVRASVNDIRYTCLFDTTKENLALGNSVIVVAPFTSERTFPAAWDRLVERLAISPGRVHLAWMDTPPEEVVNRMRLRGAARDLEKMKDPERFLSPDVTRAPGVGHIRIDGLLAPRQQIDHFLQDFGVRQTVS